MTKTLYFYVDMRLDIDRVIHAFWRILETEQHSTFERCAIHGPQSISYKSEDLTLKVFFSCSSRYRSYSGDESAANILHFSDIPKATDFLARYIHRIETEERRYNKTKTLINAFYGLNGSFNFDEFSLDPHYQTYKIIPLSMQISKVIYQNPATIVFWKDGTKTVVKCQEGDKYSYSAGIMHAIIRKMYEDNSRKYSDILSYISTAEEFDKACEVISEEEDNEPTNTI